MRRGGKAAKLTNDLGEIKPIVMLRPSQMVAAELRQRILRGEWHEGSSLPPAPVLAERLGISRHHLREALRLLEHDGLIRIERGPSGGVSLAVPDEDAVTRILEGILARYGTPQISMNVARGVIDAGVTGLAAECVTTDDIAELEAIVEREQTRGWWQAPCAEFHMAIARATRNRPLLVVMKAIWPIGLRTSEQITDKLEATRRTPALEKEALQAHRDLVQALAAHDSATASALMREHHAAMTTHYEPTLRGLRIGAIDSEPQSKSRTPDPNNARTPDLTCDICGRTDFKNIGGLKRHKTRIHANKPNKESTQWMMATG
jgi:DNA-binding FadR family transcriptional regulator